MKDRRIIAYVLYFLLGGILCYLGYAGIVDEFWTGMGTSLLFIGILRLVQLYRFRKDENYREKVETESNDERNRFIRNKAWAWAGYLFILITSVCVIVLKVMNQHLLSLVASYAVCLMLILYWGAYLFLRKKY